MRSIDSACGGEESFAGNVALYLGQQSWLWRKERRKAWKRGYFCIIRKFERKLDSGKCSVKAISWCSFHKRKERKSFLRKDSGPWKLNVARYKKRESLHRSSVAQLCLGRDGVIQPSMGIHVARHTLSVPKRQGKQLQAAGLNSFSSNTGKLLFCRVCLGG